MDIGFSKLGLNTIRIECAEENWKSRKVPMRLGFTENSADVIQIMDGKAGMPLVIYNMSKESWECRHNQTDAGPLVRSQDTAVLTPNTHHTSRNYPTFILRADLTIV